MSKQNNRVLGRRGARIVTTQEVDAVHGGQSTETVCTFVQKGGPDGDVTLGECH
jgi:hypothetical protein